MQSEEIAPQEYFFALRAQGTTSRPRNDSIAGGAEVELAGWRGHNHALQGAGEEGFGKKISGA